MGFNNEELSKLKQLRDETISKIRNLEIIGEEEEKEIVKLKYLNKFFYDVDCKDETFYYVHEIKSYNLAVVIEFVIDKKNEFCSIELNEEVSIYCLKKLSEMKYPDIKVFMESRLKDTKNIFEIASDMIKGNNGI